MNCEKCGGDCFDETKSKFWNGGKTKEGKNKPRWKCKNKDGCGWVKYEAVEQAAVNPPSGNLANPRPAGPLAPVYADCYQLAATVVSKTAKAAGIPFSMTDVTAAAATIFIQAAQSGRPVKAPKPEPADATLEPDF